MFSIRYARPEDLKAILKVLKHYNMHNVPSLEMPELDFCFFYVAEVGCEIVGAAGYKILSPEVGKTTLMGVHPEHGGKGIGLALQAKRMAAMSSLGCEKIITNADRPETIRWYGKHFGYRPVGTIKKEHSFGLHDVDYWTTLETDLTSVDYQKYLQKPNATPVIINAALTGSLHSRSDNPYLPLTPVEIASDAERVVAEGASIVHIHARDEDGKASTDYRIYAEIIKLIRERCPEVIICVSTSGRWSNDLEKRSAVLNLEGDAKPDMASLTLGSMNFATQANINSPETIQRLSKIMYEKGIKPETEVFDLGMLDYARYLIRKGVLHLPIYTNILLGNLGTLAARDQNAKIMKDALPIDTSWAATGIGLYQRRMIEWTIKNGGHVRVGLEDNLYLEREKKTLADNVSLVRMVTGIVANSNRKIANPQEARCLLGMNKKNK